MFFSFFVIDEREGVETRSRESDASERASFFLFFSFLQK